MMINDGSKRLVVVVVGVSVISYDAVYRMEGNFGAVKIWRLTMNSPNFPHPNILAVKKIANQASN